MNRRGIETRNRIKVASYTLFSQKGFKDVTMKDICEKTGLSRGGLYCHYESTRQIFGEIIDDMMNNQEDEFAAQIKSGLPAVTILDHVLARYREEMLDSGSSLSVAIYEFFSTADTSTQDNSLYEQYLLSAKAWKKLIKYGIETKEFNTVNIDAVFDLLVFSYQGVRMYSKLMPVDKGIPTRIMGEIRQLLVRSEKR